MLSEPSEVLWTNTAGGNNHSLIYNSGTVFLTVVKPDGSNWTSGPQKTNSSLEEWKTACRDLGPKWNRVPGAESSESGEYHDVRVIQTPSENAFWNVEHISRGIHYEIGDTFYISDGAPGRI